MKKIGIILIILGATFTFAEKVATLTNVLKPTDITIDKYLYVNEGTTIHIYDRKTYKHIKKFGKQGEGPREFKTFAAIIPQKDNLLINSLGKISFFTKEGEFIKEIRARGEGNIIFWPVKDGYVGRNRKVENKIRYFTVNKYDQDLNKVKEIYRCEDFVQMQAKGKIFWPPARVLYQAYKNKVVIAGKPGFIVDVVTGSGEPLFTIEQKDYKARKFTGKDKIEHTAFLKRRFKQQYEQVKQYLEFLSRFPEIAAIFIDSDKIYVMTWKFKDNKFEMFEYDINGKLIRPFSATIAMSDVMALYPAGIRDGLLYQLIENEDEEWDLHITSLDE